MMTTKKERRETEEEEKGDEVGKDNEYKEENKKYIIRQDVVLSS